MAVTVAEAFGWMLAIEVGAKVAVQPVGEEAVTETFWRTVEPVFETTSETVPSSPP